MQGTFAVFSLLKRTEGYLVGNVINLARTYYCAALKLKSFYTTGAINIWNRMKLIGLAYRINIVQNSCEEILKRHGQLPNNIREDTGHARITYCMLLRCVAYHFLHACAMDDLYCERAILSLAHSLAHSLTPLLFDL